MKNNLIKFALAASLVLNLTVLVTAGYHHYQQSRSWVTPLGKVMDRDRFIFEDLSLKPEQLDAMKNKAMRFHGEIDRRRLEIEGKRKELITLLRGDTAHQRAVDAVIRDISGSQERVQKMVVVHMLEIKASLGEEPAAEVLRSH